jgi:hypothetical protein
MIFFFRNWNDEDITIDRKLQMALSHCSYICDGHTSVIATYHRLKFKLILNVNF